jgi:hypothetical protein
MKFESVHRQLAEVYERAVRSGVSVRQNFAAISEGNSTIGNLSSAVALKNLPYSMIYSELDRNDQYHLKLSDGALMVFQYTFDHNEQLTKHRLGYFPSPVLPTAEEAPDLYARDDLYGDILLDRIVRFPIRFDYDPKCYVPSWHSHAHLTLGQFENCRIPASHPLSPNAFFVFIVRNFYFKMYRKNQNVFERRAPRCIGNECLTDVERKLTRLFIVN